MMRIFSLNRKITNCILLGIALISIGCSDNSKVKEVSYLYNDSEITFDKFHPNAQDILKEEFYWSSIEETGPFGSDAGSEAFYGFRSWRRKNQDKSPVEYLDKFIKEWNFEYFNYKKLNDTEIEKYIAEYKIGDMALIDIDNAIIAVGFGQYVLEGEINDDIRTLTNIAIKRELKPILIEQFGPEYHETRIKQLKKMETAVLRMKIRAAANN